MKFVCYVVMGWMAVGCGASGAQTAPPTSTAGAPALKAETLDNRADATVDRIAAKQFADAREWFDAPMREQLTPDRLRDVWSQILGQLGAFNSKGAPKRTLVEGHPMVDYDLTFERGHATARVVFSATGEVSGFFLLPPS